MDQYQAHAAWAQAVGPVAVTSLLLGEGLPKVVGLPEQEDPNNPENPDIQAIYNRTAIQARQFIFIFSTHPAERLPLRNPTCCQQPCLAGVCLARHLIVFLVEAKGRLHMLVKVLHVSWL